MTLRVLIPLIACALMLVPVAAAASRTERVVLVPIAGAHVKAAAVASASGSGTRVAFITRVKARAHVRAILLAGTCKMPSASFADAGGARADARGHANWTARLRFHRSDVAWATVSDGKHLLVLLVDGKAAACGVIPRMR
jgi:hypothetical protein